MIKKTMVKTQKTMRSGNMIVILDVDEQQLPELKEKYQDNIVAEDPFFWWSISKNEVEYFVLMSIAETDKSLEKIMAKLQRLSGKIDLEEEVRSFILDVIDMTD